MSDERPRQSRPTRQAVTRPDGEDVDDGSDLLPALAVSLTLSKYYGSRRERDIRVKFRETRESKRKLIQNGVEILECGLRGEGYRSACCTTTYLKMCDGLVVLCTMYDAQRSPQSFSMTEVRGRIIHSKLKLVTYGLPRNHPIYSLCTQENDEFYLSHRLLRACNNKELGLSTGDVVAGPTMGVNDNVVVQGIPCSTWPPQAFSMVQRPRRRSNWPPPDLMDKMTRKGCCVVPSDNDQDDETVWMLSFLLPERELVMQFNQTQINLLGYWVTIIDEKVAGSLKQFLNVTVVKHCLFWLIQEYPTDTWIEVNVMRCMSLLLNKLMEVARNQSCPNFFVKRYDMFLRMSPEVQANLLNFLQTIQRTGWRFFLELQPFRQQALMFVNLQQSFAQMCVTDLEEERRLDFAFYQELFHTYFELRRLFEYLATTTTPLTLEIFTGLITRIGERASPLLDDNIKTLVTSFLSLLMGCHLTKSLPGNLTNRQRFTRISMIERLLQEGAKADVSSGRLKMATVYIYLEKPEKCLVIVQEVQRDCGEHVINLARRYTSSMLTEDRANDRAYEVTACNKGHTRAEKVAHYVASALVFTKAEYAIVPEPIQFEMAVQQDSHLVIDIVIYCHFLKIVCKHKLGDGDNINPMIGELQLLVEGSPGARDLHVYYNLLGSCWVLANRISDALWCFTKSLDIKDRDNAAVKHLEAFNR